MPVCFHILQAGQTPLSIAQRLGYLSVIETLSQITTVTVAPSAMTGRYKPVSPETMQEVTLFEMEETSKWTSSLFLFKNYVFYGCLYSKEVILPPFVDKECTYLLTKFRLTNGM